jgi:hypothetical protein
MPFKLVLLEKEGVVWELRLISEWFASYPVSRIAGTSCGRRGMRFEGCYYSRKGGF